MKKVPNLKYRLLHGETDVTNRTHKVGVYDLPYVKCSEDIDIDFIALFGQPGTYNMTANTAVGFFQYDCDFNGTHGLEYTIRSGDEQLKQYYADRFKNVKFLIAPDFSLLGDIQGIENLHYQNWSRIASVWMVTELHKPVIPLVTAPNKKYFNNMLEGMEDTSIVAFNLKGPLGDAAQLPIFREMIKYTVSQLTKLKSIVVYTATPNDRTVYEIFEPAIIHGIRIQIPENILRERNRQNGGDCNVQ